MNAKILGAALICTIAAFSVTGCSDSYKGERFLFVYTDLSDTPKKDVSSKSDVERSLQLGGQVTLHTSVVTEIDPKFPTGYAAKLDTGDGWSYYPKPAMLTFVSKNGWKLQQIGDGRLMPFIFVKPIAR